MRKNPEIPKARYQTLAQLFQHKDAELLWASIDTRWHVYPSAQPVELAVHNWEGWWLPTPDGNWYKSTVSYNDRGRAYGPALLGSWVETPIGIKSHGKDLTITSYQRTLAG